MVTGCHISDLSIYFLREVSLGMCSFIKSYGFIESCHMQFIVLVSQLSNTLAVGKGINN